MVAVIFNLETPLPLKKKKKDKKKKLIVKLLEAEEELKPIK